MAEPRDDVPRGILHRDREAERFRLARYHPRPELAELVEAYWVTRWDLTGMAPHRQEVLPHPTIHVVVERDRSGVFGIERGKFVKVLEGASRAVGIKFHPGAFRRVAPATVPASGAPLGDVFGNAGERYERDVLATDDDHELVALADALVAQHCPPVDDDARRARRIVEEMTNDRDLARVEQVAERHDLSVRALQRLFAQRVGVAPKWVLSRYRIHEAVERLESGGEVSLAELAARLSYFDQAHFTRDFTRLVGCPPSRYAARLADRGD